MTKERQYLDKSLYLLRFSFQETVFAHGMSKAIQFRQVIGNAVPVNLAYKVALQVKKTLLSISKIESYLDKEIKINAKVKPYTIEEEPTQLMLAMEEEVKYGKE